MSHRVRVVQHKQERDGVKAKELAALKQENTHLKKQVTRLRKQVERLMQGAIGVPPEVEESPEPVEVLADVAPPDKVCERCGGSDVHEFRGPHKTFLICKQCPMRKAV